MLSLDLTTSSSEFIGTTQKKLNERNIGKVLVLFPHFPGLQIDVLHEQYRASQPSLASESISRQNQHERQRAPGRGCAHCDTSIGQSSGGTQQQPVVPQRSPGQCHQRPLDGPYKSQWKDRLAVVCEDFGGHTSSGIVSFPEQTTA